MNCPLFAMFQPFACRKQGISDYDCLKEECAWWDNTNKECAILQLSKSIYFMGGEVAQMEVKMPYLEQFKRA